MRRGSFLATIRVAKRTGGRHSANGTIRGRSSGRADAFFCNGSENSVQTQTKCIYAHRTQKQQNAPDKRFQYVVGTRLCNNIVPH